MSSDWFYFYTAHFDERNPPSQEKWSSRVRLTLLLLSLPSCRPHLALEYSGKVRQFSGGLVFSGNTVLIFNI